MGRAMSKEITVHEFDGEHGGTGFVVEVWEFGTGEIMVQSYTVDGFRERKLADGTCETPLTLKAAFEIGAAEARAFIDR